MRESEKVCLAGSIVHQKDLDVLAFDIDAKLGPSDGQTKNVHDHNHEERARL